MKPAYHFINFYPPFIGAGIRASLDPRDPYTVEVRLRLRWFNKNVYGTHFGGSLYAMCDPFFALILLDRLGPGYIVWDRAACIDFIRPGRGTVCAVFHIPPAEVERIRSQADEGQALEPHFATDVLDERGEVVAHVDKRLYVRKRR